MKRPYGTGHIYVKSGAYYGRWHTPDGRRRNRRLGPKRAPGSNEGLIRAMAEQALRRAQEAELAAAVETATATQSPSRGRWRFIHFTHPGWP